MIDKQKVMEMAREASSMDQLPWNGQWVFKTQKELLWFAALIAAAEREKCAMLADRKAPFTGCAAAIRARGKP